MKNLITAAAIFAASAFAAQAEMVELEAPMQAQSLHTGGVDMVVYYTDEDDHLQLVATYVDQIEGNEPSRIRMGLQDGDATSFSLPGHPHLIYDFARAGVTVSVNAEIIGQKVASN